MTILVQIGFTTDKIKFWTAKQNSMVLQLM